MVSELPVQQRMLRPIINFMVERWFPSGCFFGDDYFKTFKAIDDKKAVTGYAAALYLSQIAILSDAQEIDATMHEVTHNGEPVGTWRVRVFQEAKP